MPNNDIRLMAVRVARRFEAAAAAGFLTDAVPSEQRSLDKLIKTKGGLFASPKQAAYLWRWAKALNAEMRRDLKNASGGRFNEAVIDQWGAPYEKGSNAFTLVTAYRLTQSGRKDLSKMRFYGSAYVIDGSGVAAAGKLSFQYDYGDESGNLWVWPDGVQTTFVRDAAATELYDAAGAEAEMTRRIEQNRPMIDRIKELDAYQNPDARGNEILNSFVKQLEQGKDLSPAQRGVLRKFMSDVSLGDDSAWTARRDAMFEATEDKVIKPYLAGVQRGTQKLRRIVPHPSQADSQRNYVDFAETVHGEVKQEWSAFKRRPTKDLALLGRLRTIADSLVEEARFPRTQTNGLFDILMRADQLAKKGQKAPATALKQSWAIDKAQQWLEAVTPHKIQELGEQYASAPAESLTQPDPFSSFK